MLILRDPDVNNPSGSSDASQSAGAEAQTDVNQEGQQPSAESSTATNPFAQAVEAAFKKSLETNKLDDEPAKEEPKVEPETTQPDAQPEEKVEEETPKPEGEPDKEQSQAVPYERFAEVSKAKTEYETQLKQLEPLVKAQMNVQEHCTHFGISPKEYADWMDIAAYVKTDPAKALEMLTPVLQELQAYTGQALPPDLKEAVANGQISEDYARRLVAAEAKTKFGQKQVQLTQEQLAEQQRQQTAQSSQAAFQSWYATKVKLDPAFKPKASAEAPDGRFEVFVDRLTLAAQKEGVTDAQGLITTAEKILKSVNATFAASKPKVNGTKPTIRSSQSNVRGYTPPKTLEEAIAPVAAKHGLSFRS